MSRGAGEATTEAELLSLLYELVDAHADTIALGSELADELRWRVHLDYLRALQRKTREMVARWDRAAETIEPR